jgi:hypothetical protein
MHRLLFVFFTFALWLAAANFKLYMKDGDFQLVREYRVEGDRVKYYSVERSDWEEVPADLVDLKRTNAETEARKEILEKQSKEIADEEAAAREIRSEIQKIPRDPGVYRLEDNQLRIFKGADFSVHNSKGRSALKVLTPVGPLISGKSTLEIPGEHSPNVVKDDRPEFFIQLAQFESFAMIKLTPQKDFRIVERLTTDIAKQTTEQRELVETFTKQLSDNGLYKIWPQDSLTKGDYAVIEYTEGKINPQIWDFRIE